MGGLLGAWGESDPENKASTAMLSKMLGNEERRAVLNLSLTLSRAEVSSSLHLLTLTPVSRLSKLRVQAARGTLQSAGFLVSAPFSVVFG